MDMEGRQNEMLESCKTRLEAGRPDRYAFEGALVARLEKSDMAITITIGDQTRTYSLAPIARAIIKIDRLKRFQMSENEFGDKISEACDDALNNFSISTSTQNTL